MRLLEQRVAALWLTAAGLSSSLAGCQPPPAAPPAQPNVQSAIGVPAGSASGLGGPSASTALDVSAEQAAGAQTRQRPSAAETAQSSDSPQATAAGDPAPAKSAKVVLGSSDLFAGIPGKGPLQDSAIEQWLADPKNLEVLDFDLPLGMSAGRSQVVGIDKNPLTRAKIELGRQLYFDPRLSSDQRVTCASCHDPDEGFTRHTQFGVGIRGQIGGRNSPVSYNRILSGPQFWDGRAPSLEAQAIGPIANPIEMGHTHEAMVADLKKVRGYRLQFEKIFGELTIDTVGMALASFERAIVTGPSPYDYQEQFRPFEKQDPDDLKDDDPDLYARYLAAKQAVDEHPMSDSAKRGREIFFTEKGNCTACHVGANLADEKYHNLGVGMDKDEPDRGRAVFTLDDQDTGAFKTPTIRNVALSAPYMHDGSQKTLAEVVEWYAKGGHPNEHLDAKIKKLDLTEQDKKDLVEFMKACTGDFPQIARGRLPE